VLYVRKMKELKITSISGLIAAFGSGLILTIIAFLENLNETNKGMRKMVLPVIADVLCVRQNEVAPNLGQVAVIV